MNQVKFDFESNNNGTCEIVLERNFSSEKLCIPETSPDGEKVIALNSNLWEVKIKCLYLPNSFREASSLWRIQSLEEIQTSEENPFFCSFEGVLFDKEMTTLISCPAGKKGKPPPFPPPARKPPW